MEGKPKIRNCTIFIFLATKDEAGKFQIEFKVLNDDDHIEKMVEKS